MKEISPYFLLKGLLLGTVYLTLSIFFVFFVPRKAPALSELETIRIPAEELDLAFNKSADTSYFTGSYRDGELRSVTLTLESGLKLYGTNELFIQMRERPAYYNLMIHKDKTLFNQRYSIYQLADDEKILISYEFTREIKQKERGHLLLPGSGLPPAHGIYPDQDAHSEIQGFQTG